MCIIQRQGRPDALYRFSTDDGVTWSTPLPLKPRAATDTGADKAPRGMRHNGRGANPGLPLFQPLDIPPFPPPTPVSFFLAFPPIKTENDSQVKGGHS